MLLSIAVGVVGVAAGAVLIAPWRIDLHLHKAAESSEVRVRADLRWTVFGWRIGGRGEGARTRRPAKPPRPTAKRPRGRIGFAAVRAALATPGFVARLRHSIAAIGRQAWPRDAAIRGRVGFDDPADTGVFIGTCAGLTHAIAPAGWVVQIEPDFTGPTLEGDAHVRWSVRVIALVWPLVTLMASPVVWRGIRSAGKARRV